MCGIAGLFLAHREREPDLGQLRQMIAALGHRGPDGTGTHLESGLALGHTRLSIIDLNSGAQPIHNEDATIWTSYNGEIFNYRALRTHLESRGHVFYTQTDTEVIVHLYEERGEDFVHELNGQFALALWDRQRERLVLARDRAGILPLYYTRTRDGFAFASEVKALIASGWVQPALDPLGHDELFTFWAPVAPRTLFRGVSEVCPGEMLILDRSSIQPRRVQYWDWRFPADGAHRRADPKTLQAELKELLEDATQIRSRADVPVGAYLSGGLDSSSLVALLKRKAPETLETFSVGFDSADLDESPHQQRIVDHLRTRHHFTRCSLTDIACDFPNAIRHTEAPVLRTAPAPMRKLSRLVRESGVKVVLTGEGADEVLGGYDIFKEAKVRRFWSRHPDSRWRPALLQRLYPWLDIKRATSEAYLKEFYGIGLNDPEDPCFTHLPRWATTAQCKVFFSDEWRIQIDEPAVERLRTSLCADVSGWHPFNRGEYLEAKTLLPGYLLASQGDRMLMGNSVEGRFPFLDHRLIEMANALHPRYKMPVLKEKHLLRETMRPLLPDEILSRPKQPYRAPDAAAFLRGPVPGYVGEILSPGCIRRYGYFDSEKVAMLIAKLARSKVLTTRDNMAFVGILSTQLWHAIFVDKEVSFR